MRLPANEESFKKAAKILREGGVIAYPTEAVYGLGCNPQDTDAVHRILELKHRPMSAGLILIGEDWSQLEPYTATVPTSKLAAVEATWPGAVTWLFPTSSKVLPCIRGDFSSVAIRVPDHAIARQLCSHAQHPLVSTSANVRGEPPCKTADEVQATFDDDIDLIIDAPVGDYRTPSRILDVLSGDIIRQ